MASLAEIGSDVGSGSSPAQAACVRDAQQRAQGVVELATDELLLIGDATASADARSFAAEKLAAASERLKGLVEQARDCVGPAESEAAQESTRNQVDEEPTIPIADPTVANGPGGLMLPPSVDVGQVLLVRSPRY